MARAAPRAGPRPGRAPRTGPRARCRTWTSATVTTKATRGAVRRVRERRARPAMRRARPLSSLSSDQPLLLQVVLGDLAGLEALTVDLGVERLEVLGGEDAGQLVEGSLGLGVVLQPGAVDHGDEVFRVLPVLVVLEDHDAGGVEAAVGGADLAELHLTLGEGVLGVGRAEAERLDLGELDAVDAGQPLAAVGSLRAVGVGGERDRLAELAEVAERGQAVLLGVVLGDGVGVGVLGLGRLERGDAVLLREGLQLRQGRVGVGAGDRGGVLAVGLAVQRLGERGEVVGRDLHVALLQRVEVDVAGAEVLHAGLEALLVEERLVELGHDVGLGELLADDDDLGAVGAAAAVVLEAVAAAGGRGEQERKRHEGDEDPACGVHGRSHLLCPAVSEAARVRGPESPLRPSLDEHARQLRAASG